MTRALIRLSLVASFAFAACGGMEGDEQTDDALTLTAPPAIPPGTITFQPQLSIGALRVEVYTWSQHTAYVCVTVKNSGGSFNGWNEPIYVTIYNSTTPAQLPYLHPIGRAWIQNIAAGGSVEACTALSAESLPGLDQYSFNATAKLLSVALMNSSGSTSGFDSNASDNFRGLSFYYPGTR